MITLDREGLSNDEFFFRIYNDLGYTDLQIAYAENDKWTKWYRYDWLKEQDQSKKIIPCLSHGYVTPQEFIALANNRTIMDIEIVLDFDGPEEVSRIPEIVEKIRKLNIQFYVYRTGGRGVHVHILVPRLRELQVRDREIFKRKIISFFNGESIKCKEKVMIALEGSKHRKTGKVKEKWTSLK